MIFFHQKMRNWEKSLPVKQEVQKTKMLGPSGPPYVLKC